MKILDLKQGSPEWLKWREERITASDAAKAIGISPYSTPFKLWKIKHGLEEEEVNRAMQEGIEKEAAARDAYNLEHGTDFVSIVAQSDEYEFLGASLDGWYNGEILEIKHNGEKNHALALKGSAPEYYFCQMQVQMLVTGAKKCTYLSVGAMDKVHFPVLFDPAYCNQLVPKLKEFYRKLVCYEAPPLQKGDYKEMNSEGWNTLSEKYILLEKEIKAKEEMKEVLRKQLIVMAADEDCQGNGIKVQKVITKGRISYDDIPELKGVDLEPHRKESLTTWRISLYEGKS